MNTNSKDWMEMRLIIPVLMIGMVIASLLSVPQAVMATTALSHSGDAVDSASIGGSDFGKFEEEVDEDNSIAPVTADRKMADSTIYSLSGIRVSSVVRGRIYIQNGKKHIRK